MVLVWLFGFFSYSYIITVAVAESNLTSHEKFAATLYQEAHRDNEPNFALSPLSTEMILGLALIGTEGITSFKIHSALSLPNDEQENMRSYKSLTRDLNKSNHTKIASRIFFSSGLGIKKSYKRNAVKIFNTGTQKIDVSRPTGAAKTINKWVNKIIKGQTKLIDENSIDTRTGLILVNALNFKDEWKYKFNTPSPGAFHKSNTESVPVDVMAITGSFKMNFNSELEATFLELPYKNEDVSMIVVLPNKIDGLFKLENNMETVFAEKLYTQFLNVAVEIPKFRIESSIRMVNLMGKIGVDILFSDLADLSLMLGEGSNVYFRNILQKTFISVNENGTELHATTAAVMSFRSGFSSTFIADHPFLFYIQFKGEILLVGRYAGPEN